MKILSAYFEVIGGVGQEWVMFWEWVAIHGPGSSGGELFRGQGYLGMAVSGP